MKLYTIFSQISVANTVKNVLNFEKGDDRMKHVKNINITFSIAVLVYEMKAFIVDLRPVPTLAVSIKQ